MRRQAGFRQTPERGDQAHQPCEHRMVAHSKERNDREIEGCGTQKAIIENPMNLLYAHRIPRAWSYKPHHLQRGARD